MTEEVNKFAAGVGALTALLLGGYLGVTIIGKPIFELVYFILSGGKIWKD